MADNPIIVESGGSNGGGGFMGENGGWIFAILFIAILFGGIGGYGGFGGGRGGGVDTVSSVLPLVMGSFGSGGGHCCGSAVSEGFALNNLQGGINALQHGLCTSTYDIVGAIKDCCCQTGRGIDGINFNIAKGLCDLGNAINISTRDVMDKVDSNYRGIMDFLVQDKISTLTAENNRLQMAASQANQNAVLMAAMDANKAEILRRTGAECPTAAYIVQPPTPVSFTNCGQGYTGNCGCGCGYGYGA